MTTDRQFFYFALAGLTGSCAAFASPQGMTVVHGGATISINGSQVDIVASDNAVLNWNSFNIGAGEATTFHQPNAASIVWNQILDQNPSQIFGSLNANGTVVLFNQNGFYFGPNSTVNVGSLIVTTAAPPPNIADGGSWQFSGTPPLASIINYGQVKVAEGGSLFLVAEKIENHGVMSAPDGTLGLYAGKEVLISERPDGRGLSAKASLPAGAIDNQGKLSANAGEVALHARVVNVDGLIQANSLQERNGVVELVATESLNLGANAIIEAKGDVQGASSGGRVTLRSGGSYTDTATTQISVAGGAEGGSGGQLAVSAPSFAGLNARMDGSAIAGASGGSVIIDPDFIRLRSGAGTGSAGGGTVTAGTPPGTLELNVNTAFVGFNQITLQANQDITLTTSTIWNLATSTGVTQAGSLLTLQAGRDIIFENGSSLNSGTGWSIALDSGVDFAQGNAIRAGIGSLLLQGNSSAEVREGNLRVNAGKDVLVGSGFIRSVAGGTTGGNLEVWARSGDINTGTRADGYDFTALGYRVSSAGVGGISTSGGGDVSLRAGRDVIAETVQVGARWPGATGAYGTEPGDVTIEAGRNVRGNFVLRNGSGRIQAGENAGTLGNPMALNLVDGDWTVAAKNIVLSEVRNPAGTFDTFRRTAPNGERVNFLGDYSADASVSLEATEGIVLIGQNLPRTPSNRTAKPVYPGSLSLKAGKGGIELRESLTLAPSSIGELSIVTTGGGDLFGADSQGQAPRLVMSDSDSYNSLSWPLDHAEIPLHVLDFQPTVIDVSGSIRNLSLSIPEAAEIFIGKDAYNFNYAGQNLRFDDTTSIVAGGKLSFRSNRTEVKGFEQGPDFTVLNPDYSQRPDLITRLSYDPITKTLSFTGRMSAADYAFLLNPKVLSFDASGQPLLDENGALLYVDAPVPFISANDQNLLTSLYNASQDATLTGAGLQLAGGGTFKVGAQSIDLGISEGITSLAPSDPLKILGLQSPNLKVVTAGDLTMTASKIAVVGPGGSISLDVGGNIDIGGPDSASLDRAKGVFTFGGGGITVDAKGDIDVNGSRIATYDGGNISIKSTSGNIDAGAGGQGSVSIVGFVTDPDGSVREITTTIPGSGILATSLPGGTGKPGDISLVAAKGDIRASKGGIVQLAFNDAPPTGRILVEATEGDIDAGSSGIIGGNVGLKAPNGAVSGLVVASQNVQISGQSFTGTAFGGGNVSVAAGTVSGSVIGGGAVSVSAESISGAIVGNNVSTSGNATGATVGVGSTAAAATGAKSDATAAEAVAKAASETNSEEDEESRRKRLAAAPKISRTIGRVTVILPSSSRVN